MKDKTKKVKLNLVSMDGNAFVIIDAFEATAKKQGWTKQEITAVREVAMSGDYNHLPIKNFIKHTKQKQSWQKQQN